MVLGVSGEGNYGARRVMGRYDLKHLQPVNYSEIGMGTKMDESEARE